jgi:hypothetical protein
MKFLEISVLLSIVTMSFNARADHQVIKLGDNDSKIVFDILDSLGIGSGGSMTTKIVVGSVVCSRFPNHGGEVTASCTLIEESLRIEGEESMALLRVFDKIKISQSNRPGSVSKKVSGIECHQVREFKTHTSCTIKYAAPVQINP